MGVKGEDGSGRMMSSLEEMQEYETLSYKKVLKECVFVIRVDGRTFHTEVKRMKLERPFDRILRDAMITAAKAVMHEFNTKFSYIESDECSFLFQKNTGLFNRRVEKLISLIAAQMSIEFAKTELSKKTGVMPIFDARLVELPSTELVIKYFQWRQMDSHRNAISTQCFWRLVKSGKTERASQKVLCGMKDCDKNELLFKEFNVNYNNTPQWERKGTMIYTESYSKKGYNPIKKVEEEAIRYRFVDEDVTFHFKEDNLDEWLNKGD